MKMNTIMIALAALVLGLIIAGAAWQNSQKVDLTDFAQCITEAGGEVYGAYWCSNCAAQKEDFGKAWDYIQYNECSSPGSKTFNLCEGIEGVPIWARADGQGLMGRQPLEDLADFYSCELPEDYE